VFTSERGTPLTSDALNRLLKRLGAKAAIGFPIHIHMLRHARAAMHLRTQVTTRAQSRTG
jgi:site-specific recombinase XerD